MIGYPTVNRYFSLACFSFPPVLGSLTSVVWHGGAIWCAFEVLARRRKFTRDKPVLVLSLFMYLYVIASVFAVLLNGFGDRNHFALLPLITFLAFPFSYSIWSISDKMEIMRAAIWGSMAASYGALALALLQFHVFGLRAEGGAGNPLVFATAACMAGAVSLAGFLSTGARASLPLLGASAASLVAVLYSQSRTIWLAACITTLIVLWIYRSRIVRLNSPSTAAVVVVLLVAIGAWNFELISSRIELLSRDWEALVEHQNFDTSMGLRLALWQIGFDLVRESPLIGHGMHATRDLLTQRLKTEYGITHAFGHFHNGWLTLTVESGLIGAASVMAVFGTAATIAYRTLRRATDEASKFGATILIVMLVVYNIGGFMNILIGHDIIDTLLMVFLVVGSFLAVGSSPLAASADMKGRPE